MRTNRLLRIYRIIYQVLRLFTGKLKEEITDLEKELNEFADPAESKPDNA